MDCLTGRVRGFTKMLGGMWNAKIPSYSQICRRQKKLGIPINLKHEWKGPVDIEIDSTGIKVFNRGEWMRQKWALRRGWIKLHITCDVANHVITSVKITTEHESDSRQFSELVNYAMENVGEIGKIHADTAYDSRANFNLLCPLSGEAATKPRGYPSIKPGGPCLGAKAAGEFLLDLERWEDSVGFGLGRIAKACGFTGRRALGEYISAIDPVQMVQAMEAKWLAYNIYGLEISLKEQDA